MPNLPNRQASVDSRRIALEREVAIRVPAFNSFVKEYSTNISTTGMFIVSEKPHSPGTVFNFEFSVADDWKLIRGKCQVVWTRYRSEGEDRPAGMGVRFTELDAQSRRLIRWIVEKHIREGGKPFELEELRSVVDEALEQVLEAEAGEGATATRGVAGGRTPALRTAIHRAAASREASTTSRLVPIVATAFAIVAVIGLLFWLSERGGSSEPGKAPAGELPTEAAAGTPAEPAGGSGAEAGGPAAEAPRPTLERVSEAIRDWAQAWSDQDVDAYLSHYSRSFRPDGGLGLSAWKAQRRERVGGPEFIRVAITNAELELLDTERARATFFQSYRSDRMSDTVRKVLELVWEGGAWKIAEERVVG